ncbi:MAG: TetR/AcrR family transcriptional regulator [Streptosporangiales bacterium]|jgi:AcrR family transcriptional regulator|nr:TetR/AcrR family transcriptional regulator [Streptosporangiales bacterium]
MASAQTRTTQRTRRTQSERTASSRQALLSATLELMAESGYAKVSVADICRRAGRSVGSHLHHFGTKAALVSAAVDQLAELRIQAMRDDLARSPRFGTGAALDVAWSFYAGPTFVVALELWVAARTDPELREHLLAVEERIDREVMTLAAQVAPETVAKPGAAAAARTALATMRGLAMRRCLYADEDLERTWQDTRPMLAGLLEPRVSRITPRTDRSED